MTADNKVNIQARIPRALDGRVRAIAKGLGLNLEETVTAALLLLCDAHGDYLSAIQKVNQQPLPRKGKTK